MLSEEPQSQPARTGGELVGTPVAITKFNLYHQLETGTGRGTFATPNGMDVIVISLWDTKDLQRNRTPEPLKSLDEVPDGSPKVRVPDMISSTLH